MKLNPKTLPAAVLGRGIGSCIYCDSCTNYYVLESDEDAKTVHASMA